MTNDELITRLREAVRRERHCTADVIEHLALFDSRKLWRDKGYPHLFAYCRRALGYSESAAGKRIYAARVVLRHPQALGLLRSGKLHLGSVVVLSPHLNGPEATERIALACEKSIREVERLAAQWRPSPPRADVIRQAPVEPPQSSAILQEGQPTAVPAPAPALAFQQRIEPAAPNRSRVSFDADDQVVALIERARDVLRHKFPFAGLADIVKEALEALLEERDPERELRLETPGRPKRAAPAGPAAIAAARSPNSSASAENRRRVPRWVRKAVWARDQGRCAFVSDEGRRCGTRGWLEYDHVVPFARGGRSDDPANVRLLCRHHNQLMAERHFGGGPPTQLPLS